MPATEFVRKAWMPYQYPSDIALVAQLVEHVLGKDEVIGSSPIKSSSRLESAQTSQSQK